MNNIQVYQKCKNCGASATVDKKNNLIKCNFCNTQYNLIPHDVFTKKSEIQASSKLKKKLLFSGTIGVLVIIFFLFYNHIIEKKENVQEQWAHVLLQFERREKLVPKIEDTMQRYMKYEKSIFHIIAKSRTTIQQININRIRNDESKINRYLKEQNKITKSFQMFLIQSKKYPQLKAKRLFINLQTNIEGSQNRISVAKRHYVIAISEYNKVVTKFPTNVIASITGNSKKVSYNFQGKK